MKRQGYIAGLIVLCLLSMMVLAVRAAQAQQEEPAPGVARVSLINGDVSTMRGDSGDWVATTINAPLVRGDKVTTGEKSQTEIQLDHANVLRLGPLTEVRIADLTRSIIQVQIAQGLVNHTVFRDNEADIEIDTPNMAVRPLKEGVYRIQVNSATETQLIVRKGEAEVATPQGSTNVQNGRIIIVRGSDNPEYQIANAPHRDDWDQWNGERDSEIANAKSYTYTNRYYTGAQDLDRNGRWVYVPGYDWCWTPYASVGWAPYRYGYWGWQPYWGWTWVSYEPWGWAPYHYGRWFYWNSSWCWWPGYRYYGYRPYWGPAWVSFVGFGFGGRNWHFGFGYGYRSIGWLALGPYDRHYRWWGRHNSYNAVNITNITNINNVNSRGEMLFHRNGQRAYSTNLQTALTNANVRAGMSHVSTEDFVRRNVPRQQSTLDSTTLRGGQLVQGRIPVAPTRESLGARGRPVNTASSQRSGNGTERFFSRRQAPAVSRSFNEQAADVQRMMQRNPQQAAGRRASSGSASDVARSVPGGTAANANASSRPAAGRAASPATASSTRSRGAGTTGQTARATTQAGNRTTTGSAPITVRGGEQTGWRTFGQAGSSGIARRGAASAPATGQQLAQRTAPASRGQAAQSQPAQKPQAAPQQNSNWRRFGTGQARAVPDRPTTVGAPRGNQVAQQPASGRTGTSTRVARPAPQSRSGSESRSVGTQGQPAPTQRSTGASRPNATQSSGWRTFSGGSGSSGARSNTGARAAPSRTQSRSQGSQSQGWRQFPSRAAPTRSTERPALGIRKSITTRRNAPSSSSRNFGSSGRAAPSAPPSFGGASRGRSTPSRSVRPAPSRPSGSYGGGGSRVRSSPSRGSSVRSAPSRSSGGGGRSVSRSGGGRSSSAGRQGGGGRGRR